MVPQRESRVENEIVCDGDGMDESVAADSDTSFSSVDTVLREETVSNNRSLAIFSGECESAELQSWRMFKISNSARISNALKKHERCDFRYYSRLGFARKMCAEFYDGSGGFSNVYLDDDDVFYLLEVTSAPFSQENRDLCIRTVEMRVADNYSINEDMLGYKIIFYGTLADRMQSTLKPKDLILMWGGRLSFVNNERVIAANMFRNTPSTVIIWSEDKCPTLASSAELSLPQDVHSDAESIAKVVLPALMPADHPIPEDGDENQRHHPSNISGNNEDQNHRPSSGNAYQPHRPNSEDESLHQPQSRADPETRNEVYFDRRENIARDFVGTQEMTVEDSQSQKQSGETISKSSDSENTNKSQDHHSKQKTLTNNGPVSPLLTTNNIQAQNKPTIVAPMLFLATQELTIEDSECQNRENGSGRHSKMSDSVSEPKETGAIEDQQNTNTKCANAVPASPILFSDSDSDNSHTPKKPKMATVVKSALFLATQDVSNEGSQSFSETVDHSKLLNSSTSPDTNKLDQNKKGSGHSDSGDYELPIQPVTDDSIVNDESIINESAITVNDENINNQSAITLNDENINNQSAITLNDENINNQSAVTVNDESIDHQSEVTHTLETLLDQL